MPIRLQFCFVKAVFFIVGPTGTGKSKLAADVAQEIGAEIVSADAFQIYDGLDLLTAKPDATTFAKALHHLIGVVPLHEEMSSEKFRRAAARTIDEIHSRSNHGVKAMFENGVMEEVRAIGAISSTASKMIGLSEVRELLAGRMSILQCVATIQQATRRYAKRQLTWFRRQTSFEPLNLSLFSHNEAVKWILRRAQRSFAAQQ